MRKRLRPAAGAGLLSDTIRLAVATSGYSGNQLAQRAGVDASTVNRWLARRRGLSLESAERIAGVLNLRLVENRRGRASAPRSPAEVPPRAPSD